jgi:hypothetical protein
MLRCSESDSRPGWSTRVSCPSTVLVSPVSIPVSVKGKAGASAASLSATLRVPVAPLSCFIHYSFCSYGSSSSSCSSAAFSCVCRSSFSCCTSLSWPCCSAGLPAVVALSRFWCSLCCFRSFCSGRSCCLWRSASLVLC